MKTPIKRKRFIFLDRDGVINRDRGKEYVDSWKVFRFVPGSLEALRLLKENGYRVIVVSNQSGVRRGLYTSKTLREMTARMRHAVRARGGCIAAVYYCPHRPEDRCVCRKPKTGLFRRAKKRFGLSFPQTTLVGDSLADIQAGRTLRCRTILVLSGREKFSRRRAWRVKPDRVERDLLSAVRYILGKGRF